MRRAGAWVLALVLRILDLARVAQTVRVAHFTRFGLVVPLAASCGAGAACAHGGELCLAPSTDARNPGWNASVDCQKQPEAFPNDWLGFAAPGDSSCRSSGVPCGSESTGIPTYGWTISASSTDPWVTEGTVEGIGSLYLWLACSSLSGLSAATFDLAGTLDVLAFVPSGGFLNAGSPSSLMLAVGGCPEGPALAGKILVRASGAGSSREDPVNDAPGDDEVDPAPEAGDDGGGDDGGGDDDGGDG